ncbi:MAG TPA: aldehyde dehydrogenase family protein, partial [Thermomicrobiales bacterium]|nr:aldehyde dehydrogenase family protein [Thermomicrobiales bacterium]
MAATTAEKVYRNYIGGAWAPSAGGALSENRNPARPGEVLGRFQASEVADVDRAMDAAAAAFDGWRTMSPVARGNILYKAAQLVERRADEIGEALTREEGKTLREGKGETLRAAQILRFFAGEGSQPMGDRLPSANPDTFLYTERVPLGVVAAITPWNFPIAIPAWKIAPALIYGNCVVFKPAELTPLTATLLVECLAEAGLPPGVLNLVTGSGRAIGDAIVEHEAVNAISFTGSNAVGKALYRKAAESERGVKVQLELGGKNPVIVLKDANLDQALQQTINGAMLSTGQKCTATSRAFVQRPIFDQFVERLAQRAGSLRVGDPLEAGTEIGPLVSAQQRDTVLEYLEIGRAEGADVLVGGDQPEGDGYFVAPTVLGNMTPAMRLAQEEIFGPVLAVLPVDDLEEGVTLANSVKYGLSASIFTRDIATAFRFIRDIQAGV